MTAVTAAIKRTGNSQVRRHHLDTYDAEHSEANKIPERISYEAGQRKSMRTMRATKRESSAPAVEPLPITALQLAALAFPPQIIVEVMASYKHTEWLVV